MARRKHITEKLELDTSKMIRLTGEQALARLIRDCKFPEEKARRILNIAWEFENKAESCPGGYVHVFFFGRSGSTVPWMDEPLWAVVEHIGKNAVVKSRGEVYTERSNVKPSSVARRNEMPPRKRPAAKPAEVKPEVEETAANGSRSKLDNLQKYLEKDLTPTMQDYVQWFVENVADPEDLVSDRLIALAVNFYSEFQGSDFNIERREARRAARNGDVEAEEAESEQPTKGRRGTRGAAKPAAAVPAAGRGRGKPAGKASSSKAAVY